MTAPYSEVSSALTNFFLSELLQYIGNMFKKSLNVYDTWFGLYGDFKKGTFGLPYEHGHVKWVKEDGATPLEAIPLCGGKEVVVK